MLMPKRDDDGDDGDALKSGGWGKECPVAQMARIPLDGHMISHKRQS